MRPFQQGLQVKDRRPICERFSRLLGLEPLDARSVQIKEKATAVQGLLGAKSKYLVSEIQGGSKYKVIVCLCISYMFSSHVYTPQEPSELYTDALLCSMLLSTYAHILVIGSTKFLGGQKPPAPLDLTASEVQLSNAACAHALQLSHYPRPCV